jgi:site-specific DNA-methyltransferase (adenine-specific)
LLQADYTEKTLVLKFYLCLIDTVVIVGRPAIKKIPPAKAAGAGTQKQERLKMSDTKEKTPRLDVDGPRRRAVLKKCRLRPGQIWVDKLKGHRVGVIDARDKSGVEKLFGGEKADIMINDPPYNVAVGGANTRGLFRTKLDKYMEFSRAWVENAMSVMAKNSSFYVWLGADLRDGFQPLPDFMLMMREFEGFVPKNFITMRNQRGYGTQQNWMWVRQELLYYTIGKPDFKVVYTKIPRILKGYYKEVGGKITENSGRSRSDFIRPGNVWVDIQQIFYRLEENVAGCYAQKPLAAIERIMEASSKNGGLAGDFFSHSGTTLIAGEKLGRKVFTCDNDPVFAEITIRRLEHFRKTGKSGWQWNDPFGG